MFALWSDGRELHPHPESGALGSCCWTTVAKRASLRAESNRVPDPYERSVPPRVVALHSPQRLKCCGEHANHFGCWPTGLLLSGVEGNRTPISSLPSLHSPVELRPLCADLRRRDSKHREQRHGQRRGNARHGGATGNRTRIPGLRRQYLPIGPSPRVWLVRSFGWFGRHPLSVLAGLALRRHSRRAGLGDRWDSNPLLQGHNLPCTPVHHGHSASGWNRTNTPGFSNQCFHQVSFRRIAPSSRGQRRDNEGVWFPPNTLSPAGGAHAAGATPAVAWQDRRDEWSGR